MCGIIAYIDNEDKRSAVTFTLSALNTLKYRGYDSAGFATINDNKIYIKKSISKNPDPVEDLIKNIDSYVNSNISIGHTRWATHGGISEENAHPHIDSQLKFAIVQNGIVDNFSQLKDELVTMGFNFASQTDTEVIVRLIESKLRNTDDLLMASREAFLDLKGKNTIVIMDLEKKRIIGFCNGSPLVAAKGIESGYYLVSDTVALQGKATEVVFMNDMEMVVSDYKNINFFNIKDGKSISKNFTEIKVQDGNTSLKGDYFDHFMQKEIHEIPNVINEAVNYPIEKLYQLIEKLSLAKQIYVVGIGTAYNASAIIAEAFRKNSINAIEVVSSKFIGYLPLLHKDDLIMLISQSGETRDTNDALSIAKSVGMSSIGLVNKMVSQLYRDADLSILINAGPEIAVASTKAFMNQVTLGLLLVNALKQDKLEEFKNEVNIFSKNLAIYLNDWNIHQTIKSIAKKLLTFDTQIIMGKGNLHPVINEAALKIQEIAYLGILPFELSILKHGPLALVDESCCVITVLPKNKNDLDDTLSAMQQVSARNGYLISVGNNDLSSLFNSYTRLPTPSTSGSLEILESVVPMQLLSYYLAVLKGNNADMPKNLAKSVTTK